MKLQHIKNTKIEKISEMEDIQEVEQLPCEYDRINEFFGSKGLRTNAVIQISGDAGIGKTTFLTQLLNSYAVCGYIPIYFSKEEAKSDFVERARRLDCNDIYFSNESCIETIEEYVKEMDADIIVLDSYPCITTNQNIKSPRERQGYIVSKIIQIAKELNCVVIIIQHQTKDGKSKGDTLLAHSYDIVCEMKFVNVEEEGDFGYIRNYRYIETKKNRFGSLDSLNLCWDINEGKFDLENASNENDPSNYECIPSECDENSPDNPPLEGSDNGQQDFQMEEEFQSY